MSEFEPRSYQIKRAYPKLCHEFDQLRVADTTVTGRFYKQYLEILLLLVGFEISRHDKILASTSSQEVRFPFFDRS